MSAMGNNSVLIMYPYPKFWIEFLYSGLPTAQIPKEEISKISSFFFSFFVETAVQTQTSTLTEQVFYNLTHTSTPFCSTYFFGDGDLPNYLPLLVSNCDPPNRSLPSS
jgi:hypothetical protein